MSFTNLFAQILCRRRPLTLTLLALALGLVLAGCTAGSLATGASVSGVRSQENRTQTSDGGQVVVKVTWQGPDAGPVFAVVLDTHSVDLDGYDLAQLSVLRVEDGREVQPSGWDAPKGGHHRKGTLTFPVTGEDGKAIVGPGTGEFELIIRDVAGVPERVLRWTQ